MHWIEWVEDIFQRVVLISPPRTATVEDLVSGGGSEARSAARHALQALEDAEVLLPTARGIGLTYLGEAAAKSSVGEALKAVVDNACDGMFPHSRKVLLALAEQSERPHSDYATYVPVTADELSRASSLAGIPDLGRSIWALQQRRLIAESHDPQQGVALVPTLVGFLCARRDEDKVRRAYLDVLSTARHAYTQRNFSNIQLHVEGRKILLSTDAPGVDALEVTLD